MTHFINATEAKHITDKVEFLHLTMMATGQMSLEETAKSADEMARATR